MRLIIDMNMSIKWVEALRVAGFEATHWSSLGAADSSDQSIMDYAGDHDGVVLTRDLDFSAIIAANRLERPSVLHLRERDRFAPGTVAQIVVVLKRFDRELRAGAIVAMAAGRIRMRRLPVGMELGEDAE